MENFVFHNPTKILFGKNTIGAIGNETREYGNKVLLVYGKGSIKSNGTYQAVVQSLNEAGLDIVEHPGVQSNPVLTHVRAGIQLVKEHNCQVVCAVGGGSVIDEAKAICAGSTVEFDVWKFFSGKKSIKQVLPLTCVLTLAATGSEMNSGMVITHDEKKLKFGYGNKRLFPKTSILDPEATYTVPRNYTAYGAVDAISHVLEFYFTTEVKNTPVQDRFIEGLIINIMESCNRLMTDPQHYRSRAELMWCATLALNGLSAAGLGRVGFPMHMIEHSLSALYDIPHGAGLSVIIPGWMKFHAESNPKRISQLGKRIFGHQKNSHTGAQDNTIELLISWLKSIDCPTTLQDLEISENQIPVIAENGTNLAKIWRLSDYDQPAIEKVLQFCR